MGNFIGISCSSGSFRSARSSSSRAGSGRPTRTRSRAASWATQKKAEKTETFEGRSVRRGGSSRRGKVIPRLMKKFNLNDKLQTLIEQAGLKWNPVKLVHMCLAGFLLGYAIGYLFLPSDVRVSYSDRWPQSCGVGTAAVRHATAQHAAESVRRSFPGYAGVHLAIHASRPCVLGIARNDSPRVSRAAVGRVPPNV